MKKVKNQIDEITEMEIIYALDNSYSFENCNIDEACQALKEHYAKEQIEEVFILNFERKTGKKFTGFNTKPEIEKTAPKETIELPTETKDKVLNDKIEELFTMVENLKKENEDLKQKSAPVYSIQEIYKILEEKKEIERKIKIFKQTEADIRIIKDEIIETDENLLESKAVKLQMVSGTLNKVICSISNLLVITEMIDFLTGKVNERVNLLESKLVKF